MSLFLVTLVFSLHRKIHFQLDYSCLLAQTGKKTKNPAWKPHLQNDYGRNTQDSDEEETQKESFILQQDKEHLLTLYQ